MGYHIQFSGEEGCAAILGLGAIRGMVLEEFSFMSQSLLDCFARVDVPLSAINDGNITQTQGDDAPSQDIDDVCSLVHKVDFGEDTNGSISYNTALATLHTYKARYPLDLLHGPILGHRSLPNRCWQP
jgi:hypothetical protein